MRPIVMMNYRPFSLMNTSQFESNLQVYAFNNDQIMNEIKVREQTVFELPDATEDAFDEGQAEFEWNLKGRNSRVPKKANHGARPCSSVMRKMKKKGWYHKIKDK